MEGGEGRWEEEGHDTHSFPLLLSHCYLFCPTCVPVIVQIPTRPAHLPCMPATHACTCHVLCLFLLCLCCCTVAIFVCLVMVRPCLCLCGSRTPTKGSKFPGWDPTTHPTPLPRQLPMTCAPIPQFPGWTIPDRKENTPACPPSLVPPPFWRRDRTGTTTICVLCLNRDRRGTLALAGVFVWRGPSYFADICCDLAGVPSLVPRPPAPSHLPRHCRLCSACPPPPPAPMPAPNPQPLPCAFTFTAACLFGHVLFLPSNFLPGFPFPLIHIHTCIHINTYTPPSPGSRFTYFNNRDI